MWDQSTAIKINQSYCVFLCMHRIELLRGVQIHSVANMRIFPEVRVSEPPNWSSLLCPRNEQQTGTTIPPCSHLLSLLKYTVMIWSLRSSELNKKVVFAPQFYMVWHELLVLCVACHSGQSVDLVTEACACLRLRPVNATRLIMDYKDNTCLCQPFLC